MLDIGKQLRTANLAQKLYELLTAEVLPAARSGEHDSEAVTNAVLHGAVASLFALSMMIDEEHRDDYLEALPGMFVRMCEKVDEGRRLAPKKAN